MKQKSRLKVLYISTSILLLVIVGISFATSYSNAYSDEEYYNKEDNISFLLKDICNDIEDGNVVMVRRKLEFLREKLISHDNILMQKEIAASIKKELEKE